MPTLPNVCGCTISGNLKCLLIQQRYCGAMWWGTVVLINENLAFRCCTNVRKQQLSQNCVTIVRPIEFDLCLSRCMCYPVWIHCCKPPNYNFCISQGSVAALLRWGGKNYSHLCDVSSWCCMPKIIRVGQCFTELFKKWHWRGFFETQCTWSFNVDNYILKDRREWWRCVQGVHTDVKPVLCRHLWFERAVNAMIYLLCLQSTTPASVRIQLFTKFVQFQHYKTPNSPLRILKRMLLSQFVV